MRSDVHETAAERLRRLGQRYTPRRRALVDILQAAGKPLSIPEIVATGHALAMSSAYRNLAVLDRADVVHRVVTTDEYARFELAEDLTEHHHHLVCLECGSVADISPVAALERAVSLTRRQAAAEAGFEAHGHRLDLVGTCRDCTA